MEKAGASSQLNSGGDHVRDYFRSNVIKKEVNGLTSNTAKGLPSHPPRRQGKNGRESGGIYMFEKTSSSKGIVGQEGKRGGAIRVVIPDSRMGPMSLRGQIFQLEGGGKEKKREAFKPGGSLDSMRDLRRRRQRDFVRRAEEEDHALLGGNQK